MRRFFIAGVPATIVIALITLMAVPAWAHHPVLSGSTVCTNGDHVVTWTIGNSETAAGRSMSFTSISATIGAQSYPVTGYDAVVPPSGSTNATTVVPGPTTGTITLHVGMHWADNVDGSGSTSVDLISPCPGGSTTTSSTSTSTSIAAGTTTVAPTTSTSLATVTTLGGTTTSVGGETSTTIEEASTTTIGIEGTTVAVPGSTDTPTTLTVSGTSAGSLPFTGGSSGAALLALALLGAGGGLLYTSRRRRG